MNEIDGRRVKELREKKLGLTQEELVERVTKSGGKLKQTQMSKIENSWPGKEWPKGQRGVGIPRSLRQLTKVLQTSEDYLLGLTDNPQPPVESRLKNSDLNVTAERYDGSATVILSLWEVSPQAGGAGPGGELLLLRTDETIPADESFRGKKKAFCVIAWDDSNAPHAPVNTKLFIDGRARGVKGRWCLLCKSADLEDGRIIGPAFGVLMGENGNSWHVLQGIKTVVFSMAEWPVTFLIEHLNV